jgi:hypothetical protein
MYYGISTLKKDRKINKEEIKKGAKHALKMESETFN